MPKTAIKVAKSQVQEFYGTGRRKHSVARVYLRLNSKDKDFKVNGRKLDEYFLRKSLLVKIREPLKLTQNEETFDILVRTTGGGVAGQADAVKHGTHICITCEWIFLIVEVQVIVSVIRVKQLIWGIPTTIEINIVSL